MILQFGHTHGKKWRTSWGTSLMKAKFGHLVLIDSDLVLSEKRNADFGSHDDGSGIYIAH